MITESELIEIGKIGKPHGINGELNLYLSEEIDIERLTRIVLEIEGIFVPFFIDNVRTKRIDTLIVHVEGVDDERHAAELTHHIVYSLKGDDVVVATEEEDDEESDGFYASDLIGYTILSETGTLIGRIIDVDLSTENALFVVERTDMTNVYIPIADEMIDNIDAESQILFMSLPEGLLDL
ncbi:MAG: ribosome maturation factor RimM [Muribaculum sp.]|nr:ribosome maturation factor RimM [Muribaculum sp.]